MTLPPHANLHRKKRIAVKFIFFVSEKMIMNEDNQYSLIFSVSSLTFESNLDVLDPLASMQMTYFGLKSEGRVLNRGE